MITIACNCSKNRAAAAAGSTGPAGTFRVMVNGRKVYESTNETAANLVAERFSDATVLAPGQS